MATQILRTRKQQLNTKNLAKTEQTALFFYRASADTYIRLIRYQIRPLLIQISFNQNSQFSKLNQIRQPSQFKFSQCKFSIYKFSSCKFSLCKFSQCKFSLYKFSPCKFSLLNKIFNHSKHIVNTLKVESALWLNVARHTFLQILPSIR